MKLSQYGYDFSADLLAKYPAENRDESRLMVVNRAKGTIEHRIFKEIIEYFDEKDLFIFNDTKVFPARLYGNKEKTGAEIEIFLLRELNRELRLWDVLVDPARKIRIGNKLYFGDEMVTRWPPRCRSNNRQAQSTTAVQPKILVRIADASTVKSRSGFRSPVPAATMHNSKPSNTATKPSNAASAASGCVTSATAQLYAAGSAAAISRNSASLRPTSPTR